MTSAPAAASGVFTLGGDLTVHRLGFGAMRLTGEGIWGEPRSVGAAKRLLARVALLGVNLIDTADSYGPQVSERLISEGLYPYPEGLVVATKGGLLRPGPGRWIPDCRPEHLVQACEESLARLRVDRIDLYQLHAVDSQVPLEDSVGALARLRDQGKIRHVGLSNVSVEQLRQAQRVVPIVSVQNRYNLFERSSEAMLKECERQGLGFLPWSPLGAGRLADAPGPLAEVAFRHGVKAGQIALAWLLSHSRVMLPIPGTSSVEHLEENVAAARIELSPEELRSLDQATETTPA